VSAATVTVVSFAVTSRAAAANSIDSCRRWALSEGGIPVCIHSSHVCIRSGTTSTTVGVRTTAIAVPVAHAHAVLHLVPKALNFIVQVIFRTRSAAEQAKRRFKNYNKKPTKEEKRREEKRRRKKKKLTFVPCFKNTRIASCKCALKAPAPAPHQHELSSLKPQASYPSRR